MPPGTPFHAYLFPHYPSIRVDQFSQVRDFEPPPNVVHFLSHTHSDHIVGLQAKSFGSVVYCSQNAKEMLLRHEVLKERQFYDDNLRAEKNRTFKHLKVDPYRSIHGEIYYQGSRDLLRVLPLHTPTKIDISASEQVTVTLLDANHCPGAVMFLIEGEQGNVLHTGDFRAEPSFLDSIIHNQYLKPYLADCNSNDVSCTLDAIYLDTACVMQTDDVPPKDDATSGLMSLLQLYPSTTYFFINSWTWGYENVLKEIAQTFKCQIHFDRYKHTIYTHLNSEPVLAAIGTSDPSSTRFHACERFAKCEFVDVGSEPDDQGVWSTTSKLGQRVVYINPCDMSTAKWNDYQRDVRRRLQDGQEVNSLQCPLARHSSLPELKAFVSLFRPHSIIPNTLDPNLHGLDRLGINRMFASCLSGKVPISTAPVPTPFPTTALDGQDWEAVLRHIESLVKSGPSDAWRNSENVALKNMVGDDAIQVATIWMTPGMDTSIGRKLDLLRSVLSSGAEPSRRSRLGLSGFGFEPTGDDSASEGEEDARGRTMHKLFASPGAARRYDWDRSSDTMEPGSDDKVASPHKPLTPVSSPLRPVRVKKAPRKPEPPPTAGPSRLAGESEPRVASGTTKKSMAPIAPRILMRKPREAGQVEIAEHIPSPKGKRRLVDLELPFPKRSQPFRQVSPISQVSLGSPIDIHPPATPKRIKPSAAMMPPTSTRQRSPLWDGLSRAEGLKRRIDTINAIKAATPALCDSPRSEKLLKLDARYALELLKEKRREGSSVPRDSGRNLGNIVTQNLAVESIAQRMKLKPVVSIV
ncbi:hypothetical protein C8J56DRAFT_1159547 [Mycena floridula]|nr:hypothetical protein C8J56DRAFT_1159547 [Mycena floridula]